MIHRFILLPGLLEILEPSQCQWNATVTSIQCSVHECCDDHMSTTDVTALVFLSGRFVSAARMARAAAAAATGEHKGFTGYVRIDNDIANTLKRSQRQDAFVSVVLHMKQPHAAALGTTFHCQAVRFAPLAAQNAAITSARDGA